MTSKSPVPRQGFVVFRERTSIDRRGKHSLDRKPSRDVQSPTVEFLITIFISLPMTISQIQ